MSQSSGGGNVGRFTLTAPPPVRALGISAGTAVIGALMLVVASIFAWSLVVTVLAAAVLAVAIALALIAVVLTRRLRTDLTLDDGSITVSRGRVRRSVPWSKIETVTLQGARLAMITSPGGGEDLIVANPRTPADPTFRDLVAAVQQRLDHDRGYQPD